MTIGIAVVCEGGKAAVLAADRLYSQGNMSFEHTESKIIVLNRSIAASFAWSDSSGTAIRDKLIKSGCRNVEKAFKTASKAFGKELSFKREKFVQRALNTGYHQSRESLINANLGTFGAMLLQETRSLSLSSACLIAGWSKKKASFRVGAVSDANPHWVKQDTVGTIGSGAKWSSISLKQRSYSPEWNLEKAVACVLEAKRFAECADGVGKATDLIVLRKGKKPVKLKEESFTALDEIINGVRSFELSIEHASKIRREIKSSKG